MRSKRGVSSTLLAVRDLYDDSDEVMNELAVIQNAIWFIQDLIRPGQMRHPNHDDQVTLRRAEEAIHNLAAIEIDRQVVTRQFREAR